jgi:flagellar motility protein MotE (MotC chaperone)
MNDEYKKFFTQTRMADDPPKTERSASVTVKVPAKRRAKAKFPSRAIGLLAFICGGLGWWTVDPSLPDRLSHLIEVRMMGAASAASGDSKEAKTAPAKVGAPVNATATSTSEVAGASADTAGGKSEENSHLNKLRERKISLDLREKELGELEEELHKQKEEIEARIRRLEELRGQISTILKERVEVDQEKVAKLVETYSNMKPKQAAEILGGIDEDLAVDILAKMKKKNAAEIMNLLEAGKARSLSERYAGYKQR